MRRLSANRIRSECLMVRLTVPELALVRAAAEAIGDPPSTFCRRVAVTAAARRLRPPTMKIGRESVQLITGGAGGND